MSPNESSANQGPCLPREHPWRTEAFLDLGHPLNREEVGNLRINSEREIISCTAAILGGSDDKIQLYHFLESVISCRHLDRGEMLKNVTAASIYVFSGRCCLSIECKTHFAEETMPP